MSIAPGSEVSSEAGMPLVAPDETAPVAVDGATTADDRADDPIDTMPDAAPAEPGPALSAPIEAVTADDDGACFRWLLDGLEPDIASADSPLALVADEIRRALDLELDSETLLDRLTEALADEGSTDGELRDAAPALAAITIRSLLQALGADQPGPEAAQALVTAATDAVQALVETGIPGAVRGLPGIVRQLARRAAQDRIGDAALIPALRRIAERVAFDPDLVRRLSGRGPQSRPPATAAYGAAAFRQQPMRCRIDGPVEIIIVRR